MATNHHLATAAGPVEQASGGGHRQLPPMRPGSPPTSGRYLPTVRARHAPGCGIGEDCGGRCQCRTCLNGTDPVDHGVVLVISLRGDARPRAALRPGTWAAATPPQDHTSALSLPGSPFFPQRPTALHHPRWRLPALSASYPQVSAAIDTPENGATQYMRFNPRPADWPGDAGGLRGVGWGDEGTPTTRCAAVMPTASAPASSQRGNRPPSADRPEQCRAPRTD